MRNRLSKILPLLLLMSVLLISIAYAQDNATATVPDTAVAATTTEQTEPAESRQQTSSLDP